MQVREVSSPQFSLKWQKHWNMGEHNSSWCTWKLFCRIFTGFTFIMSGELPSNLGRQKSMRLGIQVLRFQTFLLFQTEISSQGLSFYPTDLLTSQFPDLHCEWLNLVRNFVLFTFVFQCLANSRCLVSEIVKE
jgi:hypothetical protein